MFKTHPIIESLVQRFPRLFRGHPPRVPSDLPEGWADLTVRMFTDLNSMLDDANAERFEVIQIKEKFAGLRVYWSLNDQKTTVVDLIGPESAQRLDLSPADRSATFERIKARVRLAEEEASATCQRCGCGEAQMRRRGWMVTLCDACAASTQGDES
jgi:hypothetical protein